ncbi:hypothetical protein PG993_009351 [Apiospora rasikravindrae]|uniref:Uncharacterized protein n=1 Tax=Apiospora rasikravindrae TaxID=990691 RepID=A0ABR1SKF3_9PEZI
MPKASPSVKTERLAASSRQGPYPNMQGLSGRFDIAVRPAASNQQRILPCPSIQPFPSAFPAMSDDRMQRPAAAPPGPMPPPPPPRPSSSVGGTIRQATPRPRADMWSFISGILMTNEFGHPLRKPEDVARILHKFISEPLNKKPHVDGRKSFTLSPLLTVLEDEEVMVKLILGS